MLRGMENKIPPHIPIAPILIHNILTLARALAGHRGIALSTLARRAHPTGQGDPPLFDRMAEGKSSITAPKYDELMTWFAENWPDDLPWPMGGEGSAPPADQQPAMAARKRALRKTKK